MALEVYLGYRIYTTSGANKRKPVCLCYPGGRVVYFLQAVPDWPAFYSDTLLNRWPSSDWVRSTLIPNKHPACHQPKAVLCQQTGSRLAVKRIRPAMMTQPAGQWPKEIRLGNEELPGGRTQQWLAWLWTYDEWWVSVHLWLFGFKTLGSINGWHINKRCSCLCDWTYMLAIQRAGQQPGHQKKHSGQPLRAHLHSGCPAANRTSFHWLPVCTHKACRPGTHLQPITNGGPTLPLRNTGVTVLKLQWYLQLGARHILYHTTSG